MASHRPVVFDTSVYVAAIRAGSGSEPARLLRSSLPRTHLAAVVAGELRAGALTLEARRAVTVLVRAAQTVGRIVAPTLSSWVKAGEVMASIRQREPAYASKLPRLWNDVLVVLSAVQIGAIVVTTNRDDFALVRRHIPFSVTFLDFLSL